MLVAAINADIKPIYNGAPVAGYSSRYQLDKVVMAGGSVLAAGLAKSGAIPNGVINVVTSGILTLQDWTLVASTKLLVTGGVYRLASDKGKLSLTGTGQVIGIAASNTDLIIQISSDSGGATGSSGTSGESGTSGRSGTSGTSGAFEGWADGGHPDSNYGGIDPIQGGTA